MKKIIGCALAALAATMFSTASLAQTACKYINANPGNVLTASQWNYCFQQKNDSLGFTPMNQAGGVMTGKLTTAAPTTSVSGFNLPPGVAPTAPHDGDIWTTSAGVYAQINGSTVGPIGAGIPASSSANLVFAGPTSGAAAAPSFRSIVSADLPIATSGAVGAVKPDGSTTSVNGSGAITATTATSSTIGVVKPDNSTINISAGALSAATATSSTKGIVQPDNSTITILSGTITAHLTSGYNQQTFTASGTFTTPVNSSTSTVFHYRCQGGGGGGGGTNASTATGGGGGSGAYAEGTFTSVSPSTAITITVGSAGTGGNSTGSNGSGGGNSSVGSPVTVTCGGGGGGGGSVTTTGGGGGGGNVTGVPNMLSITGQRGQGGVQVNNGSGSANIVAGGVGGNSMFGFGGLGGQAVIGGSPQSSGSGYGSGGAGSISTAAAGSGGAPGIVIIDWIM